MAALRSSWQIAVIAGEPHSTIRVQNLQASVCGGRDAWGRNGKTQPILISATISLREPFEKASTEDSVNNSSTVNYGTLSRAILGAVESFPTEDTGQMLRSLLDHILRHLTARGLDFRGPASNEASSQSVLDRTALKSLELKLMLPKASLIGSGVSLSGTIVYAENGDTEAYSMTLKLHKLRIPTLIGVNSNERLAKQIVLSNIELDFWSMASDLYNELEEIVVKTIEESSFQTLEALATHVSQRIILYFLIPRTRHNHDAPRERIKICLEKPTAVTFADAPAVEILVEASPTTNPLTQRLLSANAERKMPPFPLSTRFDLWIQENDSTSNCVEYTIPS